MSGINCQLIVCILAVLEQDTVRFMHVDYRQANSFLVRSNRSCCLHGNPVKV